VRAPVITQSNAMKEQVMSSTVTPPRAERAGLPAATRQAVPR
jgi:hypothetical protein